MTTTPNLDDLLTNPGAANRRRPRPADIQPARDTENRRRSALAHSMATRALIVLHEADFDALHKQAKAKVAAECCPLPGDDL